MTFLILLVDSARRRLKIAEGSDDLIILLSACFQSDATPDIGTLGQSMTGCTIHHLLSFLLSLLLLFKKVCDEMTDWMKKHKVKSLDEIRGCAHK